jgi:hypothetical protein
MIARRYSPRLSPLSYVMPVRRDLMEEWLIKRRDKRDGLKGNEKIWRRK